PELLFHRLSEQKKFSVDCAAPGKTCLTAEVAYSRGDQIDKMSPEQLIRTVLDQVCGAGLARRGEFIDGTVNRQQAVYPLLHKGSRELALKLIEQAVEAGCDAIKFQTYQSSARISGKVKKVRYAETTLGEQETLLEMFQRLELTDDDHKRLFEYARERGIDIFSTPFDSESVDLLEGLGVHFYKIASFDLVNVPLLRYVAATKKPMIVSTGMSTLGQVEEALEAIRAEGNRNVILL